MSADRDAAVKRAEKLAQQGRIEEAIALYVRHVEEQPEDWTAANALGDLYVRAGDGRRAVTHFVAVADHFYREGFLQKAGAVYKKALRAQSNHEHTLRCLADIATRQELFGDARRYFQQLAQCRREKGDEHGAVECLVAIARLEGSDPEARLSAARGLFAVNDMAKAALLFKEAADAFDGLGQPEKASAVREEARQAAPGNLLLQRALARAYLADLQLEHAASVLTREVAGDEGDLLFALGRLELARGREASARALLARAALLAPERHEDIRGLIDELVEAGELDSAYGCLEILVDAALLGGDWETAVASLRAFLARAAHVPAVERLLRVSNEIGRADVARDAEVSLADALLAAGRGDDARTVCERLVAREPHAAEHRDRLRRALELLGLADAERLARAFVDARNAEAQAAAEPALANVLAVEPEGEEVAGLAVEGGTNADVEELPEVDLSDALATLAVGAEAIDAVTAAEAADLDAVFADMRGRARHGEQEAQARARLDRGLELLREGHIERAVVELDAASRVPAVRFEAASALGRVRLAQGEVLDAVECFERASEVPPPSREDGWSVMYELADALEQANERARALAVLIELESEAGQYRDVQDRIAALSAGDRRTDPT